MSGIATAVVGSAVIGGIVASKGQKAAADAANRATDANAYQGEIATEQWKDYKDTFQPLEHDLAAEAKNADSQANYDKAASAAQATVSSQIGMAKDRLQRTPGMDPSSAAAQTAQTDLALKGAAMGAAAQNTARENVTNMAYAKKQDAVALGKGLVSNATSGLASAAAGADAIARSQAQQAGATAQGAGAMVSGVVNGLTKVNWGVGGVGSGGGGQLAAVKVPAGTDFGVMNEAYAPPVG
jgi:hypothetical protein